MTFSMMNAKYEKTTRWMPIAAVAITALTVCLASLLPGCNRNKVKRGPANVLLITMDTTRADRLGCYGYSYIRTPNIDSLAKNGVLYENCLSAVPLTLPSHSTIMTGLYPPSHGVRNNNSFRLPDGVTTIAEILKGKGYATGAVVAAFVLERTFGLNQGFDTYDDSGMYRREEQQVIPERKARTVTNHALAWIKYNADKQPFFLWVHYYDPHFAYAPPSPFAEEYAASPYDGEIAYVDSEIKRLLNGAREASDKLPLITILTGDHGESLGEHGEKTHGLFVYHSTLHVPMIVNAPGMVSGGLKIANRVSNVSIAPTILDMLGMEVPSYMQGRSLMTPVENKDVDEDRELYAESWMAFESYNWSKLEALSAHGYYFIDAPRDELYDIKTDPDQLIDIAGQNADTARRMGNLLESKEKDISREAMQRAAEGGKMTAGQKQNLAALGYLTIKVDDGDNADVDNEELPDPKDHIDFSEKLMAAMQLSNSGEYEGAVKLFGEILKDYPDNPMLLHRYAVALAMTGDKKRAIEYAVKTLGADPDYTPALELIAKIEMDSGNIEKAKDLYLLVEEKGSLDTTAKRQLAKIALQEGDEKEAEKYLWSALEISSKNVEVITSLYDILERQSRGDEVVIFIEKGLEESPTDTGLIQLLARIRISQGETEKAVKLFKRILEFDPDDASAHYNLAIGYLKLAQGNLAAPTSNDYLESALEHISETLRIEPDYPMIREEGTEGPSKGRDIKKARDIKNEIEFLLKQRGIR